ncbi:MAG: tRNA uridine-5-carboxymethylaminomethyl(34) synthesis GTPase MnmE [Chlorobi bacterium]|nr:tRNA uridine-5-carboxymethylaminomethyl(34) synthesis GTPase MnmE [Chlorobiota bacterium]
MVYNNDTICAPASPAGSGAIALLRLSGRDSLSIALRHFKPRLKSLSAETIESHKQYFGDFVDGERIIDEILLSYFKSPHSYTAEDVVEISCHGSVYVQQLIIEIFLSDGARMADAGEFTMRAFHNGRLDLSQAEGVADLIASRGKAAHQMALNQMRGGFSDKIKELRAELLDFTSLIELELDFAEEDVEFADREDFLNLVRKLKQELSSLINSFKLGNVIKHGIPVAIIGKPNAGKSTLLNALLNEERAIVSEIPGTTRDSIEDTIVIDGYTFRFIDTAGLRESNDKIESMGIERTYEKMEQARLILYVCDISRASKEDIEEVFEEFKKYMEDGDKHFIFVANKIDHLDETPHKLTGLLDCETVFISAKRKENIHLLASTLVEYVKGMNLDDNIIVNNSRHYEALKKSFEALAEVEQGFGNNIPTDLISVDIRSALHHLGTITGEITNDEVLGNIFGKFCIGK